MTKSPPASQDTGAFSTLPVVAEEREWSFLEFTWVNIGLAIATWAFLIGGTTALFVGAKDGIAAIIIGNIIGVSITALSACQGTAKYGVEHYTFLRSVFGRVGVRFIALIGLIVFGLGWTSVLGIMFGRATSNIINETFGAAIAPSSTIVSLFALVSIAISWVVIVKGPISISWLNRIVGPGLVLVSGILLVMVFKDRPWSQVAAAPPIDPFDNSQLNFMIAVELNIAAGLGWWPVMGNLSRLTKSARAATWPNLLGIGVGAMLGETVGLIAALTLGSDDPTVWSIPIAGAVFGVVILAFIALANVTSIVGFVYSSSLAARQLGSKTLKFMRWSLLTATVLVPGSIGVFFPEQIYDNFFRFLAWTALAFAPLAGVSLADYYLRRRRVNVSELYIDDGPCAYSYEGGVNIRAFISVVVGALVYILLLNPQTLDAHRFFGYITASLPACMAAGCVYVMLMWRTVSRRKGEGDDQAMKPEFHHEGEGGSNG